MPDIPIGSFVTDLAFHPTESVVFASLLNGKVKSFRYDEEGKHMAGFDLRPSKRACRGLEVSINGGSLHVVGKSKAIHTIDTSSGKLTENRLAAHEAAINRIKQITPNLLATGDDDGVVKLWDPRKPDATRTYTHHFDFITDFMWIEDKKHLVVTSGDGTLSVLDVRSSKPKPFAHSEDQEDELLSIVPIRGGEKTVVGTQIGVLSVFNRSSGWGDCVDRVPGHPQSIDTLHNLPSSWPSSHNTILTGSSDGLIRAVQLFPTKLIGIVADHGDFPVERIKVDRAGQGRWMGSVGHDEIVKLTDLKAVFDDDDAGDSGDESDKSERVAAQVSDRDGSESNSDSSDNDESDNEEGAEEGGDASSGDNEGRETKSASGAKVTPESDADSGGGSDSDEPQKEKKRKKKVQDPFAAQTKKKKKGPFGEGDPSFFAGL